MYLYIILVIAAGFLYESISWFFRLQKGIAWIRKERSVSGFRMDAGDRNLYVLIPVLAEADVLEDTARYFWDTFMVQNEHISLVLITTEKERVDFQSRPDTIDVARMIHDRNPRIIHIHFPETEGKIAHQLNYAIRILAGKGKNPDDTDLFAIYNADSRPERETFAWVQDKLRSSTARAFQQYGCYTGNMDRMEHSPWREVLVSAALWQTRWAIGFELYNSLKQQKFIGKKLPRRFTYPFNYCIGHGFFATRGLLREIGEFNEDMHNEDAILGLQLCEMQEPFLPIPYFDMAESPEDVPMLYKQKANWYFGPLQAYGYARHMLGRSYFSAFRRARLFLLASKLFLHALFWIIGPSLLLLALILGFSERSSALIVVILSSYAAFSLQSVVSYTLIRKIGLCSGSLSETASLKAIIAGSFVCYMLHGASAYKGLAKYIVQITSGKPAIKEKTIILRNSGNL